MTGLVNEDDRAVRLLDSEFTEKSEILPLERKRTVLSPLAQVS